MYDDLFEMAVVFFFLAACLTAWLVQRRLFK